MNPQHINLALSTPLEDLLAIPQGVQLAYNVREGLEGITPEQAAAILGAINGMIENAIKAEQALMGSELVSRDDNRDVEWLMQALTDEGHLVPADLPHVSNPIYFLVLAAYKLGGVIEQRLESKTTHFPAASVSDLLEAQEASAYAELIPPTQSLEEILGAAWRDGLTPETTTGSDAFHKARMKRATDARHLTNRIAKKQAIELYFSGNYRTIDAAATSIAEQVFRAPGTVRNWIFEARRERDLTLQ
jgi:hypothetical protein